ncbi:SDR family NAD(P)-dependent oxidoreductase [Rhodococcus koreensis]
MSWELDRPFESLSGTTAVVTGAAGGIGTDVTAALVELGVTVIAGDMSPDSITATEKVVPVAADVSTTEGTQAMADAVEKTGQRLSLWLNNAGAICRETAMDTPPEEFDRVMDVNARGTFLGSRAAYALMSPHNKGAIVNVASLTASRVQKLRSVYGPSKAAIVSLTEYLGEEWGPSGVTVNAVAPGYIDTTMSLWYRLDDAGRADLLESIPQRRLGTPADITAMVLTLASPLSAYVTGQTFRVDGGHTL